VTRVFISDCEGPISKNDNALEVTTHFVPHGKRIFTTISKYDDILADLIRRLDYRAGGTLMLILPFLKAYGVTDRLIREFSHDNLTLIPEARRTMTNIKNNMPTYIVSTSYEQYIQAVCKAIGFPLENTYSTKLSLDKYHIDSGEKAQLKKACGEISKMQIPDIPIGASSLAELSAKTQSVVERLDQIFWRVIQKMKIGRIYSDIEPIGGIGKAEAVRDVTRRVSTTLEEVMYVGDSITDEDALKLVKKHNGLAVSFNGNRYAVKNADIAVMSQDSQVTDVIAEIFLCSGKTQTLNLVSNWSRRTLELALIRDVVKKRFLNMHPRNLPKTRIVTNENMENLIKESSKFRNKVRGDTVGRLG